MDELLLGFTPEDALGDEPGTTVIPARHEHEKAGGNCEEVPEEDELACPPEHHRAVSRGSGDFREAGDDEGDDDSDNAADALGSDEDGGATEDSGNEEVEEPSLAVDIHFQDVVNHKVGEEDENGHNAH